MIKVTGDTSDLTGADAANYTLTATTEANSLTVSPKAITYSIAAGAITYGASHTAGAVTYDSLETGDLVSATAQIDSVALSTANKIEAGTYAQSLNGTHGGADVANYTSLLLQPIPMSYLQKRLRIVLQQVPLPMVQVILQEL
jgi:hypothetical protein